MLLCVGQHRVSELLGVSRSQDPIRLEWTEMSVHSNLWRGARCNVQVRAAELRKLSQQFGQGDLRNGFVQSHLISPGAVINGVLYRTRINGIYSLVPSDFARNDSMKRSASTVMRSACSTGASVVNP